MSDPNPRLIDRLRMTWRRLARKGLVALLCLAGVAECLALWRARWRQKGVWREA